MSNQWKRKEFIGQDVCLRKCPLISRNKNLRRSHIKIWVRLQTTDGEPLKRKAGRKVKRNVNMFCLLFSNNLPLIFQTASQGFYFFSVICVDLWNKISTERDVSVSKPCWYLISRSDKSNKIENIIIKNHKILSTTEELKS